MNTTKNPSLGDRYTDVAVIVVLVVALLLGWTLMTSVQSRSTVFSADGISAQIPSGWRTVDGTSSEVLHLSELTGGFGTTYIIEIMPVTGGTTPAQVISMLTLERGQTLTAYRVLDQQSVTVGGREGYRVTFAYVESNPNVSHADVPVVVRGADFIFVSGGRAIIVSYRASEDNYTPDFARFRQFLESMQF